MRSCEPGGFSAARYVVVTNNASITLQEGSAISVLTCSDGNEVFRTTRDLVHRGARLVNHPLGDTLLLSKTPIKSMVLDVKESHEVDMQSLMVLENSLSWLGRTQVGGAPRSEADMRVMQNVDWHNCRNVLAGLGVFVDSATVSA